MMRSTGKTQRTSMEHRTLVKASSEVDVENRSTFLDVVHERARALSRYSFLYGVPQKL